MLDVLLESRSHTPRRLGGTIASALLHTALITAAVAVARPTRGGAVVATRRDSTVIYVVPPEPAHPSHSQRPSGGSRTGTPMPTFSPPNVTIADGSVVDLHGGPVIDDVVSCRECTGGPVTGSSITSGLPYGDAIPTGVVDGREVDRAPRLLGTPVEPHYPAGLRESGVQGSVVAQFVVDTLGRVELGGLQIIQSPHALFTESVREALARYRFAPGEVAGRRVPTRVQIPFEFRLR
jgi:protein TonB